MNVSIPITCQTDKMHFTERLQHFHDPSLQFLLAVINSVGFEAIPPNSEP